MFRLTGKTHPGRVRSHNEDAFYCSEAEGFVVVADGMGGYAAGEVASDIVVKSLAEISPAADGLVAALVECHTRIAAHAEAHPDSKGMGSAAVVAKLGRKQASVCWAGDSRAYLFNPKAGLKPVTRDHSYVQWLLSQGQISESQARIHPDRNLVTQCLGINPPQPELTTVDWESGDTLLLCSDGLTDELDDQTIAALLHGAESPAVALDRLIAAALESGGKDNITVVLADNLSPLERVKPFVHTGSVKQAGKKSWLPILFGVGAAITLIVIGVAFRLLT